MPPARPGMRRPRTTSSSGCGTPATASRARRSPCRTTASLSPPRLTAGARRVRPVRTLQFSPGGSASGTVRAAGLGCSAEDFQALRDGEIALVDRGTCFFRDKALNAQRAGAAAVIVADTEERPVAGSLQRPGPADPGARGRCAGRRRARGRARARDRRCRLGAARDRQRDRRVGRRGRAAGRDGRRPPRLRPRRPGHERQRQRRRRAPARRRAARRPRPAAAVRVLGRRGDRPRRLAPLRRPGSTAPSGSGSPPT